MLQLVPFNLDDVVSFPFRAEHVILFRTKWSPAIECRLGPRDSLMKDISCLMAPSMMLVIEVMIFNL